MDGLLRSANRLLTDINDILEFFKVKSGRLDMEEVLFNLDIAIQDISKVLRSVAAERKSLVCPFGLGFFCTAHSDSHPDKSIAIDSGIK